MIKKVNLAFLGREKNIKLLFVITLLFLTPANLYAFCSEPYKPHCIDTILDDTFEDEWEFRRCKSDVEDYEEEWQSYVQCEAKKAVEDASSKAETAIKEVVRKFNCKANAEDFCY